MGLAGDAIFSFSRAPLRIATYMGLVAIALGVLHSVWLLTQFILGSAAPSLGWSYLIIVTHLIGGAILCCLGILGEYVGRIFEQVKERPVYLLKEQSEEVLPAKALPPRRDAA
jgi:ABC-type thiamin/hydroxymethylpyrimidine transport system permease subunit